MGGGEAEADGEDADDGEGKKEDEDELDNSGDDENGGGVWVDAVTDIGILTDCGNGAAFGRFVPIHLS